MLFKLVATVYLVVNGAVDPTPIGVLTSRADYPSAHECERYLDTEKGARDREQVSEMLKTRAPEAEFRVAFGCVQKEDGSI